ncbi:RluA family pseudouridine synthase [Opacimonas viscosa]|uniref:Pseudouridine synthase n=1 Tax=Opacimonas viscosa TaxID=2961944 RepID=A0AA42BM81_9ALTE|nr:RluA family pseudouridine synthase [Opacimonas viscosa]MCP3428347.1 RluA family pseudouridine synthase [Opacimonas viscosa]
MAILNYQPPMTPYLDFLYQDEHVIVVNKPAGILSVRGRAANHQDSIQKRINDVFPEARIVHRLDMATSGILVLAMHKSANQHLSNQFAERKTQKRYFARVLGLVKDDEGECNEPLIVDWPNRPKQKVCYETGKRALTRYTVLQRDDYSTLVELKPVTGRSHQLRVHMLSLGHPILGDRLYSEEHTRQHVNRLHLHAAELGFYHPATEQWMSFTQAHPFSSEPNRP